ncbi:MAG: polyprenyl synthetase family protein [Thermoanaerobaculia bacterium]
MNDYFNAQRALVDRRLAAVLDRAVSPDPLREPLQRALSTPGKRFRGVLTLAVGETWGVRPEKLLDAACAFEMIHTCSLVLDDLPAMDDAELRRGLPALHRAVGEDLAILAAVALLNHAYGLIADNHAAVNPRRWPLRKVLDGVVQAVGWDGTIGGEAVDLHSEAASLDFGTLEYIHSRKTGALFGAAAVTGAMLANAPTGGIRAIEQYAKNLGLAFQITDDILDVTSTPEQLGKDVGKDEQKLTFVKLAGVEGARQLTEELIDTSLDAIAFLGGAAKHLREIASMVRDRVS